MSKNRLAIARFGYNINIIYNMYIDKDSFGNYQLMGIDNNALMGLETMIEGAGLEQRRTFNPVLEQIKKMKNE